MGIDCFLVLPAVIKQYCFRILKLLIILIDALLLHNEDFRAGPENLIAFPCSQFPEPFYLPCFHITAFSP